MKSSGGFRLVFPSDDSLPYKISAKGQFFVAGKALFNGLCLFLEQLNFNNSLKLLETLHVCREEIDS